MDASVLTISDPACTAGYCNSFGYCDIIDIYLSCYCTIGYVGSNCHIDKNGYTNLANSYNTLYNSIMQSVTSTITFKQLQSLWNLFFSASTFHQDPTFFSSNLDTFMVLALNSYSDSILNNTSMYFDLYDFYYNYALMRMNQMKFANKNSTNYPYRNVSLTTSQAAEFANTFSYIRTNIQKLVNFVIQQSGATSKTFKYTSKNMYIAFSMLTPTFNETDFFSDRIAAYSSWATFMDCINHVEINGLNNPYYQAWFIFIEYQAFPFSYDKIIYQNNTSPLSTLYFIDASTNKPITVTDCSTTPITFYQPFTSYNWINQLNFQKWLYDPNNYKAPNDPIFSAPIYINETGYVSNDTIENRIEKYHRKYNFSCSYYNTANSNFSKVGINYTNFTDNYIAFNTSHLTEFSSFFVQNDVTYSSDGRFFYLKYPYIFLYGPNYVSNYAFYITIALIVYYIMAVFITSCYDWKYFKQEALLEFLKQEIAKVHSPYDQKKNQTVHPIFGLGMDHNEMASDHRLDNFDDFLKRRNNDDKNLAYEPEKDPNDIMTMKENKNNADGEFNFESGNIDDMFNFNFDGEDKKKNNGDQNDLIDAREKPGNMLMETGRNNQDSFGIGEPAKNLNNFLAGPDKEQENRFGNYIGVIDVQDVKPGTIRF